MVRDGKTTNEETIRRASEIYITFIEFISRVYAALIDFSAGYFRELVSDLAIDILETSGFLPRKERKK